MAEPFDLDAYFGKEKKKDEIDLDAYFAGSPQPVQTNTAIPQQQFETNDRVTHLSLRYSKTLTTKL